ncbi:hypothetical protein WJX77_002239 [Trebouxia sp. C0004]
MYPARRASYECNARRNAVLVVTAAGLMLYADYDAKAPVTSLVSLISTFPRVSTIYSGSETDTRKEPCATSLVDVAYAATVSTPHVVSPVAMTYACEVPIFGPL